jgi:signal transduction histidine kinase
MKISEKIATSKTLRFIAFAMGFICIFACFYKSNFQFAFSAYWYMDIKIPGHTALWGIGFVLSTVFTAYSVWRDRVGDFFIDRVTKADYSLLFLSTACAFYVGYELLKRNRDWITFVPLAVYIFAYLLLITTIVNIRDKKFARRLYFVTFYKAYPAKTSPGFAILLLQTGMCLILLSALNPIYRQFEFTDSSFILITCSLLGLSALAWICCFITSLSAEHEKIVDEKLKSERLKIELITNVSHDIRTPLTSIINYVDLIKNRDLTNEQFSEYIAVLENKTQRLKTLISDLMEASKAGAGDISVNLRELDLAELVGQAAGDFDEAFTSANLTFVYSPPNEKITVFSDGTLLFRIMENVFANAVKYSLAGTRVYCDISQNKTNTTFSLKNISREQLNISADELTERFVRGDSSRSGDGSGLGLYIAKSLAELIGARFDVIINGDLFEIMIDFG